MSAVAGLHDLGFDPDPANHQDPAKRNNPSYWFFMADAWDEFAHDEAARGLHEVARRYQREAAMWRDWAFKLARQRRVDSLQRRFAQSVTR